MFNKIAIFSKECSIKALNEPKNWDIYNLPNQIKTASINIDGEDLGGFDLKSATKEHPDFLYVKIFAIKEDEVNDNGDAFCPAELKKAAETFVGVPLFTNHQNDDVEKAKGECVHSWYDKEAGGIYIIGRVDKLAYPKLARTIEEGYVKGTSMGTSVEYSVCSVCHVRAATSDDYCAHIRERKNKKYSGNIKCKYHDCPDVKDDEKCPLCSSTKDDIKTNKHSEQEIYEHNYGLKFIENSFVVNPACHDCGVTCILNSPEIQKKVAEFKNSMNNLMKYSNDKVLLNKIGGVQELNALKNSMSEIETVVKSMLQQKDNVSMEYVSDLVKAMADLQSTFDELNEMGYGALPSPEITAGTTESPEIQPFPEPVQAAPPPVESSPKSSVQDMGGLGTITTPKKSSKNKEDFSKISKNIIRKIDGLSKETKKLKETYNSIGAKMAKEKDIKTAAGSDNLNIITEKQLEKKEENLHPRTEEVPEGITESKEQIGGEEKSNDTTSDSPQVRTGTYETITEDQLKTESALGAAIVHFSDYPDVITEKQWEGINTSIGGDLPEDYTEQITQAQIRELLSKHKFIGNVETITEDQLKNISMTDGLTRWASGGYAMSLMKTAIDTVVDTVVKYQKSPEEINQVINLINDNHDILNKVAFLSIVNSLPQKKAEKEALVQNNRYFSKTASQNTISTMDSLILAASENGQLGMKAEDLFNSIYHASKNKIAMNKINEKIKEEIKESKKEMKTSRADALNQALKIMERPEDGKYQIKATMEDIGVPITDKVAFLEKVNKFAQEMIGDDDVAAAVIKIEVGDNGELIIDIQDGAEESICPDDIGELIEGPVEDIEADDNGEEFGEENREEETKDMAMGTQATAQAPAQAPAMGTPMAAAKTEIEKKAQMMGGEMGGQGGMSQAPGAGASLPAAPGGEIPPVESLGEEPGMEETSDIDNDGDLDPLPPGSLCGVCGSNDVDVISGKSQCHNCGAEWTIKIDQNYTKWPGTTPTEGEGGDELGELGELGGEGGEGFEMPAEEEMGAGMGAEMPAVAAHTRITPEMIRKISSQNIKLGSVSPATGSINTVSIGDGQYICMDTGTKYKISYVVAKDTKQVYGQWEWIPKIGGVNCESCDRKKQKFVKALKSIGMTEEQFDNLELQDKVKTIVKLNKSGDLNKIKTAGKEGSAIKDYKVAYGTYGDKFPIESCIEKLARRFGKDALCLSGPDEGKNLAESVCNRLKKADVYVDKLAVKVASIWSDDDGDEDCVEDQIRAGYKLREAVTVCESLKTAVAQPEYIFAEELGFDQPLDDGMEENPFEEPIEEDIDPFDDENIDEGTVTIELPTEVAKQLEEAVEVATGESPEAPGEEMMEDNGDPMAGDTVEEIAPGELDETKPNMMQGDETEIGGAVQPCAELEQDMPEDGVPTPDKKVQISVNDNVVAENKKEDIEKEAENIEEQSIDYKEALNMSGGLGKVGKPQMDLSDVIKAINKTAGEKEISQQKAQDSKDIGSYTAGDEGSKMGHEGETIPSAGKPSVPRDNATMGQEPSELNPQDKPQPVIPSENATMGHEDEAGLSGGDNRYTGGDKGQGKTELASADADLYHMKGFGSSKDSLSRIADRIAKKLAPKEPVAKDKDIQPISGDSTIGKEEKFDADEVNESEVKSDSGFMGHENETLKSKPDSPKDHPEVNTGNAQMGKEELDSEKTTKDKGTVIAESDSKSEAYRVAGRMLQAGKIEASELQTKIDEFKTYKLAQIKDIEKNIFAGQKGLDTVSDGMSQAVQINEASNVKDSGELSSKLQNLFTLNGQNKWADKDETTQMRKDFK